MKTETLAEYLARGGKVTICTKGQAKGGKRKSHFKSESQQEAINYEVVPTHLKIALGIK